jgi:hypothetical protein
MAVLIKQGLQFIADSCILQENHMKHLKSHGTSMVSLSNLLTILLYANKKKL